MTNGVDLKQAEEKLVMFDKSDFLVFEQKEENFIEAKLPDHMLSFNHDSWAGYMRSVDDRQEDKYFASHLKNICRG
jgi:hypothetical protein